ncbi:1-acyl-sn-glycerol-3-phosphate acyltransferase [Wohlfahrtiimonas chitiniclastica]|uniref:1-acyl-sn-glycerol-3-phosphate acyltransferase n=1 Tax=Wohlfahrtiimonas chitiniclastica TaxID=400946 RepID=A0AB35C3W1_9GAMM|nr:lysophospholipid acyltransferase family protein [Wohlfahrtiimonas chitiniclastica]KZX36932.1 acyl-phosphate glycerol 3-phosphate acyltransferase [Wohlfahrtiimonas chitiniclastica]MBS7815366.1 1-acyl-sn-glycerol-3-phosphate acyltransferase [Wohlfahrtiimonas chitiniclastica]MBS7817456.1 1-acyl-sn-glycerol-3-phosphate acyltransferase [Wohlfahrtiimonas chitiniclastica]MBS7821376.1 1-acyl-sn-glycerol-3-phosphate acyltransferase [Wohlfahrtiimonas chitiniclastica]MBS7823210.1 1-acyl-sn-glycerol-3-
MIQWIRSLLYFITLILIAVIFIPFMILVSYFMPERQYYPLIRAWCGLALTLLRIIAGVKYKVNGLENIALLKDRPAIIISNHQSTFETFLYPVIFPVYCFVLKKELLRIPIFGQGLKRLNPVAIDRSEGKKALKMMIDSAKARLADHIPLIIFPEGTRVAPDQSIPYKNGAFLVASKLKAPILPVSHNSGCAWPRGKLLKKPGTIEVTIGPLIESEGKSVQELNDATFEWIESHKKQTLAP